MADAEDKEKAEKVAAARKRYEQLKKQKAKKGGAKKDKAKTEDTSEPSKANDDDAKGEEEPAPEETPVKEEDASKDEESKNEATIASEEPTDDSNVAKSDDKARPSLSAESRMRSESFKRSSVTTSASPSSELKSPTLPPLSADGDAVQDIYRKQVSRIETLEKENKRLEKDLAAKSKALGKSEGEVEDLREEQDQVGELRNKAKKGEESAAELEKLRAEIAALQRQNSQLQSAATAQKRRSMSTTSPSHTYTPTEDLATQLATKTSTIESLELDMSNLRHSLNTAETKASDLESRISDADSSSAAASQQLTDLKASLAKDVNTADTSADEQKTAETRLALLTSDLAAAQKTASDATARALALEKKIDALTTLHRESETRHQSQGKSRLAELEKARKDAADLRRRLASTSNENARLRSSSQGQATGHRPNSSRKSVDGDSGGVEELEDEERAALQSQVRALEAENFDLRRGVFQKRRSQMDAAAGMLSPAAGAFDDVDLSDGHGAAGRQGSTAAGAFGYARNMFNTITGGMQEQQQGAGQYAPALFSPGIRTSHEGEKAGLMEGDDDGMTFDEDAFRVAQEEEARARLERVREVKRGLEQWRGWRADLVDVRGGSMAGVFDV
ncbi:MAG: hypothetical protein M1828_007501 [Chrysothrix sp. TS-e1954]|nr:MAG: hypothetical protein M1828_007501 [Chrysothrix sp. TS-e1954]